MPENINENEFPSSPYVHAEDFTYYVNGWKITNCIPELRSMARERAFLYDTMRTVVFSFAFIPPPGTYFNLDVTCSIICPGCGKEFSHKTYFYSRSFSSEFVTCEHCKYRFDLINQPPPRKDDDKDTDSESIFVLIYSYIFPPQTIDTIHMPILRVNKIDWSRQEDRNIPEQLVVSQHSVKPPNKKWWQFWN